MAVLESGLVNRRLRGYSIIGSGSGFTVNLGSDSLGKSNDLGMSNVCRIQFGFGLIVNPDPDPIIKQPLRLTELGTTGPK